ncbi:glycosyltransferase family 4 protein [Citrobacter koseri]|uniref:glycosyltransferase family 4 protein n=1 Tax=Citrobacter koseri TaxID=545 RepID=UPI003892C143
MSNKIVLSANTSWYLYNFRRSTIQALNELGYHVVCISPYDVYSQRLINELGVEWFPLYMLRHSLNPLKDMQLFWQFYKYYKKIKPVACLHFTIKNNVYGSIAAKLSGSRVINNITGLGTLFIKKNIATNIAMILYKISDRCSDIIFCQNKTDRDFLIEKSLSSKEKLVLIPGSGVDLKKYHPSKKTPSKNFFRFLYVGRMLRDKGIVELIDAFNSIDQSRYPSVLYLVGFVDEDSSVSVSKSQIEYWAKENPQIIWLGPQDSMVDVYADCDCVILPSYREGLPRSLLEAGAMGLPSITTNVPGCNDVIVDGFNGFLCEVKNTKHLEQKMIELSSAGTFFLNSIGNNARINVEQKYDEQIVIQATIDALKKIETR